MKSNKCDPVALSRLYRREHPMLVRFLIRMTRCRAAAEDVAQMTWLKLICALERGVCAVSGDNELRAYLYEVARNTFIDEHTRKHGLSRTRATDPGVVADLVARTCSAPSAEEELSRLEISARIGQAIDALPKPQQEVVRMWCAGASIEGMAARAAAPRDTVLSRKKYAFARMRQTLAPLAAAFG
jgi:RNA polymerase sigma factor (sigma-70 family)